MVVFTCGHCGESVQKPKVEKHYMTKCRNRSPNLSCMDCFKDFLGNSYDEHTKCITEEERYSGKDFVPKEKKGEKKQSTWIEMVQSVLDEQKNASKTVLRIIETICKHNNTPRKKPKFINFVKNVCGHKTNPKDIDQAWDLISVKLAALSNANQKNQHHNQKNGQEKANGELENQENGKVKDESEVNGEIENEGQENEQEKTDEIGDEATGDRENVKEITTGKKKLSKKERKEEKKRQKYEAELQSAEAPPEEEEEQVENKKGKKKKNRTESQNGETEQESKKNKRKRQDTVNSVNGVHDTTEVNLEILQNGTIKTQKKKAKIDDEEDPEQSMCLHDQNVAKIGELAMTEKFNWHAVIFSVLQKKGNELPFKRLQKKVLSEYSETTGREVDDRIAEKFIKKLKSAPNVRVDKNRVTLLD